jgi:hypothetical protein
MGSDQRTDPTCWFQLLAEANLPGYGRQTLPKASGALGFLCERLFPRARETSELRFFRRRLRTQKAEKSCAALQKEMQRGAIT